MAFPTLCFNAKFESKVISPKITEPAYAMPNEQKNPSNGEKSDSTLCGTLKVNPNVSLALVAATVLMIFPQLSALKPRFGNSATQKHIKIKEKYIRETSRTYST